MSAAIERAMWLVLVSWLLVIGAAQAWHARSFDPKPDAVQIGTALVCDRTGCVES